MTDDTNLKDDTTVDPTAAPATEPVEAPTEETPAAPDADAEPVEAPAEEASEVTPEVEAPAAPAADETPAASSAATPAGTDQQGRQLYNVKCSNCGKDTQVPFQPTEGRPVYCRDCFAKMRNAQ